MKENKPKLNNFYLQASQVADQIVFVSNWLRQIYLNLGMSSDNSSVILSWSDKDIFNSVDSFNWDKDKKLKIITHHWSPNINKGQAVYKLLDDLIGTKKWKDKLNLPMLEIFQKILILTIQKSYLQKKEKS